MRHDRWMSLIGEEMRLFRCFDASVVGFATGGHGMLEAGSEISQPQRV